MGGYQFYNEDGPLYPLSPEDAVELVTRGHLVLPTGDELKNQSKGDALSKGVAIVQTLWFVTQCIVRHIEHLPVTSLEVMTLAYTVITLTMYAVWWNKPLNISCTIRVPEEEVEDTKEVSEYDSKRERIVAYIMGLQDQYVDLRKCTQVPTFWAADRGHHVLEADLIALLVAMVFGAVHCIAWSDAFRSPLERQMWRVSAIAIVAVPAGLVVALLVAFLIGGIILHSERLILIIAAAFYVPLALIYVAARIVLILISFSSLSILPIAAYKIVGWTTFVPHV